MLQLIAKICNLGTKRFYDIGPSAFPGVFLIQVLKIIPFTNCPRRGFGKPILFGYSKISVLEVEPNMIGK